MKIFSLKRGFNFWRDFLAANKRCLIRDEALKNAAQFPLHTATWNTLLSFTQFIFFRHNYFKCSEKNSSLGCWNSDDTTAFAFKYLMRIIQWVFCRAELIKHLPIKNFEDMKMYIIWVNKVSGLIFVICTGTHNYNFSTFLLQGGCSKVSNFSLYLWYV